MPLLTLIAIDVLVDLVVLYLVARYLKHKGKVRFYIGFMGL